MTITAQASFRQSLAVPLSRWHITIADAGAPPAIAAPNAYPAEVTRIVIATVTPTPTPAPTQTARVEYRVATNTPTPALILCDVADENTVCVRLPPSPTATALPPDCRTLSPVAYQVQVCRKGDGATSAKGEIQ